MLIIKKSKATVLELIIKLMTLLTIIPIFLIIGYIFYTGIPSISWSFLTEMPSNGMRAGGIFPAIVGTLWLTLGTIIVSVPFGILTGVYLVEYAKDNMLTRIINLTIINLAGIPSIIYGLFGMALFVIFLGFDVSILSGSLTLGIMCLLLTIALCVQIRTMNSAGSTVSQTLADNDLRDQVLRMKERYDNATRELQSAQKRLEEVRQAQPAPSIAL